MEFFRPMGAGLWVGAAVAMVEAPCSPESEPRGAGGVPCWTQKMMDIEYQGTGMSST